MELVNAREFRVVAFSDQFRSDYFGQSPWSFFILVCLVVVIVLFPILLNEVRIKAAIRNFIGTLGEIIRTPSGIVLFIVIGLFFIAVICEIGFLYGLPILEEDLLKLRLLLAGSLVCLIMVKVLGGDS